MRINNECARRILLEIEKIPYGETMTVADLHNKISDYTIEDVLNIVTIFNKGHYLLISGKFGYEDTEIFRDNKIKCLTERGYRNLDLIRDDKIWNSIKEKLPNFNELSIYSISDLASKITNYYHNELFDLPLDLIVNKTRW